MRARTGIAVFGLGLAVLAAGQARAQAKRWTDIKSPPLPAFQVEKPETFTLKNGMRVFLMEDHELPVVNVNLRIKTGGYWDAVSMNKPYPAGSRQEQFMREAATAYAAAALVKAEEGAKR